MEKPSLLRRLLELSFGGGLTANGSSTMPLDFFPKRLPEHLDALFFEEYIRALRMPVIWITVAVFFSIEIGICYFQSAWPYVTHLLAATLLVGILTIAHIFWFWNLLRPWGYKVQLTVLNVMFGILVSIVGWGAFMSWQTMPDHYIGMMTTIFGAILGAAAVILSYSRISYLIFMGGLIVPGTIAMLTRATVFHNLMGLLFVGGFFAFILINLIEHAKQRELFDARNQLTEINSELTRKDNELDQELLFASHIQMGIFPEPKTRMADYTFQTAILPLGRISGDYCDIITRGDIIYALVADASGHGVPAALLTMAAKNVFSNVLTEAISPAAALATANREILKMIKTQDYMTGFLLKLYPSGLVEFSNAAHPTAFFQSRGGDVKYLDTSGFILGGLDDVDALYETASIQLRAGDRIFLYTDGVVESTNLQNKFYGVDRLEKLLRVTRGLELAQVTSKIFSDMVAFSEGVPFRDDIAMMALEYTPQGFISQ
ncbi:MAG: serine/threonine-protein phosphatase [Spirochaetes bacterium]|nr:serine/threonine-protein phosphatase [Spirochaetota bacterium]